MDGNGCLDPSSTDFEQMIMLLRQRLRPTAAQSLADWLRVYLGLYSATDEQRGGFPPHDEIAQLPCLDPSVHKRQLRAVLTALLSKEFATSHAVHGADRATNDPGKKDRIRDQGDRSPPRSFALRG